VNCYEKAARYTRCENTAAKTSPAAKINSLENSRCEGGRDDCGKLLFFSFVYGKMDIFNAFQCLKNSRSAEQGRVQACAVRSYEQMHSVQAVTNYTVSSNGEDSHFSRCENLRLNLFSNTGRDADFGQGRSRTHLQKSVDQFQFTAIFSIFLSRIFLRIPFM